MVTVNWIVYWAFRRPDNKQLDVVTLFTKYLECFIGDESTFAFEVLSNK